MSAGGTPAASSRRKSRAVPVLGVMFALGFAAVAGASYFSRPVGDDGPLLVVAAIVLVVLGACSTLALRGQPRRVVVTGGLLALLAAPALGYGGAWLANWGLGSSAEPQQTTVVSRHLKRWSQGGIDYSVRLKAFPDDELPVDEATYEQATTGSTVEVFVGSGALGVSWVDLRRGVVIVDAPAE